MREFSFAGYFLSSLSLLLLYIYIVRVKTEASLLALAKSVYHKLNSGPLLLLI